MEARKYTHSVCVRVVVVVVVVRVAVVQSAFPSTQAQIKWDIFWMS